MAIETAGALFFGIAVFHTFFVGPIGHLSRRFAKGSLAATVLHLLSEVEIVFGFWAGIFLLFFAAHSGIGPATAFVDGVRFTEPLFVFAIMVVCSSAPILDLCRDMIVAVSRGLNRLLKTPEVLTEMFVILALGSLAGSFITEPAAMTVTAILLRSMIHTKRKPVLYAMIGVLFVNVSIGGALTTFAAPPILMVAGTWGWDVSYVFLHIGWKSAVAVVLNSLLFVIVFRDSLKEGFYTLKQIDRRERRIPRPVTTLHLACLVGIVASAHHEKVFLAMLVVFLGLFAATKIHQQGLRVKEALLVAVFLGGIVLFGPFQSWWLRPLIANLSERTLFLGATALTAITDNAALTYLGAQIPGLGEAMKNALVEGALAGGGLTIIANAPNPAGAAMLREKFPDSRVAPGSLLLGALVPTAIAVCCLWFLPFLG